MTDFLVLRDAKEWADAFDNIINILEDSDLTALEKLGLLSIIKDSILDTFRLEEDD